MTVMVMKLIHTLHDNDEAEISSDSKRARVADDDGNDDDDNDDEDDNEIDDGSDDNDNADDSKYSMVNRIK